MNATDTARSALHDRLTRAATEIELIQSCMEHTLPKEAAKLRSLSAVLRSAGERLQAILDSETAYDKQTFLMLAQERLSALKTERGRKMRAKRERREEMARERQMFLREMAGLDALAA